SLHAEQTFFKPYYRRRIQRNQAVFQPRARSRPSQHPRDVGPHVDPGCITLRWQDEGAGTEVLTRGGEWLEAPPLPGTMLVNVGALLSRWSNDRLVANLHRVKNKSDRESLSLLTFYDPSFDAIIDPADLRRDIHEPVNYRPIGTGEFLMKRLNDRRSIPVHRRHLGVRAEESRNKPETPR
ncbi:MAG TPA: 2OG-Fe(II) oxygenase family protein, partial [Devosia sp.]